jgi:hypothetical protein
VWCTGATLSAIDLRTDNSLDYYITLVENM